MRSNDKRASLTDRYENVGGGMVDRRRGPPLPVRQPRHRAIPRQGHAPRGRHPPLRLGASRHGNGASALGILRGCLCRARRIQQSGAHRGPMTCFRLVAQLHEGFNARHLGLAADDIFSRCLDSLHCCVLVRQEPRRGRVARHPGPRLVVGNGVWSGLLFGLLSARFRHIPQIVASVVPDVLPDAHHLETTYAAPADLATVQEQPGPVP